MDSKSMDWFHYDNGLRHERVKKKVKLSIVNITLRKKAVSHKHYVSRKPL